MSKAPKRTRHIREGERYLPDGTPLHYKPYHKVIPKGCFSLKRTTQVRNRTPLIKGYDVADSKGRYRLWKKYLQQTWKLIDPDPKPKKGPHKWTEEEKRAKAIAMVKKLAPEKKLSPTPQKGRPLTEEAKAKLEEGREKAKTARLERVNSALEAWDEIFANNEELIFQLCEGHRNQKTGGLLKSLNPRTRGFKDVRGSKDYDHQLGQILRCHKGEITVEALIESFMKQKYAKASEDGRPKHYRTYAGTILEELTPTVDRPLNESFEANLQTIEGKKKFFENFDYELYNLKSTGQFKITTNTARIWATNGRNVALSGGQRSGKTASVLAMQILRCLSNAHWAVGVAGQNRPHIRRGSLKEFRKIARYLGYWNDDWWKESTYEYHFPNGSRFYFVPFDKSEKQTGVEMDEWLLDEANLLPWKAFQAVQGRCKGRTYLTYNPTGKFWFHHHVLPHHKRYDLEFLEKLNYTGNEALPPMQIRNIESSMDNEAYWRVMGLGELGDTNDLIYKDWKIIKPDEEGQCLPKSARIVARGLDVGGFGLETSRMAVVAIYEWDKDNYILDEEVYDNNMSFDSLVKFLSNRLVESECQVIIDAHASGTIQYLRQRGISVVKSRKGPGSIQEGIKFLQSKKIWVTKTSVNLIKERDGYYWKKDPFGDNKAEPDPKLPQDLLDAARYGMQAVQGPSLEEMNKGFEQLNQEYSVGIWPEDGAVHSPLPEFPNNSQQGLNY